MGTVYTVLTQIKHSWIIYRTTEAEDAIPLSVVHSLIAQNNRDGTFESMSDAEDYIEYLETEFPGMYNITIIPQSV